MPEGQQQPQHRFHRKDGQKDEWKADGQKGEQHFKGEKRDGEHRFDRQDRDGQHREGPKDKRFKHHKNPRFDQQKGNEQGQHKKDHKFGPRDGQPPLLRTQVSSRVGRTRCSLKNKDCLT